MLHIHFSNRYETLTDELVNRLAAAQPGGVFDSVPVLVPSQAVARSLSHAIADRAGICANVRFDFLARWLWSQIARLVPSVDESSPFAVEPLTWRIYAALRDPHFLTKHDRLSSYLADGDDVMRFDLAGRVASLLDQYVTYREDWLETWGKGNSVADLEAKALDVDDAAWQAALWRHVTSGLGIDTRHPGRAFIQALADPPTVRKAGLPPSAHLFGLHSIPPLHLQLLRALGERMDVHIYVVNPCQEYWFEILDRRRLSYLAARGAADGHETGNRLLAHWGRQTQSHVDQLVDALDASMLESAVFVHADSPSLLGRIQDAILDLADLSPGSLPVTDDDRSVEIHLCHSRTRELEALQDYLLGLFSKSASGGYTLQPSDILVVTPDLESTAPAIEAVFSSSPPARNIPWAITGRARSSANVSARALLNLLSLVASRCTAPEVFGSLSQPIVARRFHLDGSSLEAIRGWLRDAGVRWALDTAHRASYEVPSAPRHTLASGFDRLFLGYALPQQQQDPLFGELLPVGNAGDAGARTLGSFWRFGHELQAFQEATASELLPEQWSSLLLGSTETFLAPTEEELGDWNELRDAIAALGASMSLAGGTVPLSVVRAALEQGLEDPARGGIPTGRVTFSSMASLRMLPFRIVCVIGLDDGAFPRAHRPVEFDLMARHGRRGDRQRRDDDRNLFLDLLLAARERLYLSYVGRSIRDNAVLPPSVLVAELLDTLIPAVAADPTDVASLRQARHHLIVEHPLQSFSSTAFSADSDPRIRSHDQELADALRRRVGPRPVGIHQFADEDLDSEFEATGTEGAFFTEALSDPGPDSRAISLSQLVEFFANPSRFLLRNRLGIRLRRAEDELEDTEPLLPDHRQRQALAARLWPFALAGANPGTLRTLALAGIEVADGDLGRTALEREVHELAAFARRAGGAMTSEVLPPTTLTCCVLVEHESWRVHTVLADLRPEGVLRANFQPERPARLLDAWLHHLLLCAACPPGVTPSVAWLFQDGTASFDPPDNPTALLATLIAIYRDGQRRPARFFPRTSQAYVLNGGLRKAREMWQRSDFNPFAESTDPYYRLAFRGTPNALDAQFEACASAVFQPLVAHRRAGV